MQLEYFIGGCMRRYILLLIATIGLLTMPGCTWETARRSLLGSLYSAYGDGYSADRFSTFNDRYEEQTKAAEEYYQQQ